MGNAIDIIFLPILCHGPFGHLVKPVDPSQKTIFNTEKLNIYDCIQYVNYIEIKVSKYFFKLFNTLNNKI